MSDDLVWYASYGSNLSADRFAYYVRGGRPAGARRTYGGCRDRRMPLRDKAIRLPGRLRFAWESPTWSGGIAFYDPAGDEPTDAGAVLARAYLITRGQLSDVIAQEMHREPGHDLDLGDLWRDRRLALGPGRYETLHHAADLEGHPVVTFTSGADTEPMADNAPSPAYLRMIVAGLRESHRLDDTALLDYLAAAQGVGWSRTELASLLHSL